MIPGFSYAEDGPTADLTVDTWGETLEEVFRQSAIALFNAITPIEGIRQNETREFEVEGHDLGALLFNFSRASTWRSIGKDSPSRPSVTASPSTWRAILRGLPLRPSLST